MKNIAEHARKSVDDYFIGRGLTPRELDTLKLIVQGMSNKEVAREMGIAGSTVKIYVRTLFEKLEVSNRIAAAVAYCSALGMGVVEIPEPDEPFILLLRGDFSQHVGHEIGNKLLGMGVSAALVAILQVDQEIERLDEDQMRKHGWVRAESSGS